jgi:Transglutaminase-like superfamily
MTSRAVEAAVELTRASVVMRVLPSRRTAGLLGSPHSTRPDVQVAPEKLDAAVRVGVTVARVASRLPWHPTCLRQAVAAQRMLRRRGIPCSLHLGVTGVREAKAHAWVTVDGKPIVGQAGLEQFIPLAAFG